MGDQPGVARPERSWPQGIPFSSVLLLISPVQPECWALLIIVVLEVGCTYTQ